MREKWTEAKMLARVKAVADKLGVGYMPTRSMLVKHDGNALAVRVSRTGFDTVAGMTGLELARHDSRKGWEAEDLVAGALRKRGYKVRHRESLKSPWDLMVDGVDVEVKVANGAIISGDWQWTWRVVGSRCSIYVLVAQAPQAEPAIAIAPEKCVGKTCVTARGTVADGAVVLRGKWGSFVGRFDLL